ncbi:hypothetical protein HAX54_032771, partial [Datura stramonium]|nr:hypothetical protein [Datura stramonium]
MDYVHVNVEELIVDQFKCKAKQQATALPFPNLDKIVRADGMITLATKTDKDAPGMKRAKCTTRNTSPPPLACSTTSTAQFHPTVVPALTSPHFLKIDQRAQVHE